MSKGHVFIVQGDLRKIACDAWLVPCGGFFDIGPRWLSGQKGNAEYRRFEGQLCALQQILGFRSSREALPHAFPAEGLGDDRSQPWLVRIGAASNLADLSEMVMDFFERVFLHLSGASDSSVDTYLHMLCEANSPFRKSFFGLNPSSYLFQSFLDINNRTSEPPSETPSETLSESSAASSSSSDSSAYIDITPIHRPPVARPPRFSRKKHLIALPV